jgi:beta-lactamase regulating signal transducer with metallopeptidase domain
MIAAMVKSAIILVIAACVASLMKRQSAAVRHAVWTAGLIGAMAIPLCTLTLPVWETEVAASVLSFFQTSLGFLGTLRQVAVTIWIAGATAGILLLLYSAGRLAWVAIGAEPVEDARWEALAEEARRNLGISRPVRLLQNRSVPFLGTWGILVPRVLLPRDAEVWPDERIRMVLAHELAHIQRHDWVVQVLADAARAIYWFNPIFWIATSQLRRESEHACDDAVVRLGSTGTRYAEELLAMTRALRSNQRLQSPILAMAQPSHLEQRLVALLNPSLNRLAATPWAVILVAGFAIALTLPLAAFRPGQTSPLKVATSTIAPTPETQSSPAGPTQPLSPPPPATREAAPAPATAAPPKRDSTRAATVDASKPETAPLAPALTIVEPEREQALQPAIPTVAAVATPPAPVAATPPPAPPPPPPFECNVTRSVFQTKSTMEKAALGNGPWIINEDRTLWAADQPYIANTTVNTIWMRPPNTELTIAARRLDRDAPKLTVGPAAPYQTAYLAIGVVFPSAGCWEVTATAGESKLTFVTRVRE